MPILFTLPSLFLSIFSSCSAVTVTVGDNGQVLEGSAAVLTCDYERTLTSSNDIPLFIWQEIIDASSVDISVYQGGYGGIETPYSDSGRYTVANDSILTITNISRSDNARRFQCDVSITDDNPRTADATLTLSVAFAVFDIIMFEIISSPVIEGESVTFICSINANPDPEIILYKDETEIMRETTTNLTYTIDNVMRSDAGNYKCEASNIAGSGTSQIEPLDVYYKPTFGLPEEITVVPGEVVVIAPDVSANPNDITYQWTTDPPGIDDTDTNHATFTFKVPESAEDGKIYTITVNVTNSIGSTTMSVIITFSNFDVDTILFEISNSNVIEGGSVMFVCSVNANPDPEIILYKDETEITRETTTSLTYTIDNAMRSDGGNYTCEASNIAGSGTSQIEILVVYHSCADDPCENGGTCTVVEGGYNCHCTDHFSGLNCSSCSSCTSGLTIGMFFAGIFVGAFGLFAGLVGYMKIKQMTLVEKKSTDKRKKDTQTYMEYRADTGNENQTYQDLQQKEEESAYVNVKPGKNKK